MDGSRLAGTAVLGVVVTSMFGAAGCSQTRMDEGSEGETIRGID